MAGTLPEPEASSPTPARRNPTKWRRVGGLFAGVATAGSAAMLFLFVFLANDGLARKSGTTLLEIGESMVFWFIGSLSLMPFILVPAFIGGAIWILIIESLGEDHWALYAAGGALIAGAWAALFFGPPMAFMDDGWNGRLSSMMAIIFMAAGGAGGISYRWIAWGGR